MIENNLTWIGMSSGILLIVVVYLWSVRNNENCDLTGGETNQEISTTVQADTISKKESIRQIALIEKDEFKRFYQPICDQVQEYERMLTKQHTQADYFDTVYKALRKRRSAIFEYGSSETDQQKRALWTYALFSAISIRYIVARLNNFEYRLADQKVNPMLLTVDALASCERREQQAESTFKANVSNVHLIDKVLSPESIERLNQALIYPFLVNAVTGFYQDRITPFYTIIEQVENHMSNGSYSEECNFRESIEFVLGLIQRNIFIKNQPNSLVFEGLTYLLVDRNLLWELSRMYSVSSSDLLGKKAFEKLLIRTFGLVDFTHKNIVYTVQLEDSLLDIGQEKITVELINMLALPYKAVPDYRYTSRRRIQKKTLQRDISIGDVARGLAEGCNVMNPAQEINQVTDEAPRTTARNTVDVNDLFSERK